MEVVQINLHHARTASSVLTRTMVKEGIAIGLVQEPWVGPAGNILGLSQVGSLIACSQSIRPRACIVFGQNTKFFPITEFVTTDLCAAEVIGGDNRRYIVASAYFPGEDRDCPPTAVTHLVDYANRRGMVLILGCDANAHHTAWGSTNCNDRGESLFEFILGGGLSICNVGNSPTFVTLNRSEVLDVTLTSKPPDLLISNWTVSDEPSCSDHRHIRFSIGRIGPKIISYRSKKSTNWTEYNAQIAEELDMSIFKRIDTADRLERSVNILSETAISAFENNCPLKSKPVTREVIWWSDRLGKLRKGVRKLFNKSKKTGKWEDYSEALANYNKEIKQAKSQSFKNFCADVSSTSASCRLHKALALGKATPIGTLTDGNGIMTKSAADTAKVLISTHFPGATFLDVHNKNSLEPERNIVTEKSDWTLARMVCRPEAVKWAISTFKPYKSAGMDGIFPALLQQGANSFSTCLSMIYTGSLAMGYIPVKWRMANVIHLHKPGKNRSEPKSFRPISLMSFVLKGMEKIVERHIRDKMSITFNLHANQHAYQQGKSTETALSQLVDFIDRALDDKEICLIAFLDIEGAFNNTTYEAIEKALAHFKIESTISRWIMNVLRSRVVTTSLGGATITAKVSRGCPQGGVLSPLLWSMVVDELFYLIRKQGVEVIGYADDIALIVRGSNEGMLCKRLQGAIVVIQEWCVAQSLSINPKKSVIVPFTRKRKLPNLKRISIFGEEVDFSSEVKYLGVLLDSKLNWKPQIDRIVKRATIALWTCKKLCNNQWGLNPIWTFGLYVLIVRPIITYGSIVWWKKTMEVTTRQRLDKVQRMAGMCITGCLGTTPGNALAAFLGLPPLHLVIKNATIRSIHKLFHTGAIKTSMTKNGHLTLLSELVGRGDFTMPVDLLPTKYMLSKAFSVNIPNRSEWVSTSYEPTNNDLIWYTDGSKTDAGTGWEMSQYLGKHCSVFQAEVMAINLCARENIDRGYKRKNIVIFVDSQAALKALQSTVIKTKLILETINVLEHLAINNRVTLHWIPAHCGHEGNEKADSLAKAGADNTAPGPEPFLGLSLAHYRQTVKDRLMEDSDLLWQSSQGNHLLVN